MQVAAVERRSIAARLQATGETAALRSVRLASPVAGRVTAVAVQPGDRLAAGAVAARVLPQENEAALHGFGILAQAGALRPEERPAAARLARDLAGRDIALAAPFEGVVADRLHNPGEQVAPSDVLVELFDPRSLIVLAQVPLARSAEVRAGQPALVRLGGTTIDGRVAAVVTAVSPQSLTVPVRIALTAPAPVALLHAAADCHITVAVHDQALLVPSAALLADDRSEHGTVMVVADGVARRRAVRIGLRADDVVELFEGVAAGELVVVSGHYGLPDGAAVTPQAAATN
ncbi:HlyD family efflux transporter periplasmic adaptor subunit [bacterium]|nr:HlyD family efflux transporter periplasmic adaptor subunit [bacterium]